MTLQSSETIYFLGNKYETNTLPLSSYLYSLPEKTKFFPPSSSCWRGYIGTWEVIEDQLFLIKFKGCLLNAQRKEYREIGMEFLFPHQKKVFAEWFTGEIIIPQGDACYSAGGLYPSFYESEIILEFKEGYIIGQRTKSNHKWIGKEYKTFTSIIVRKEKMFLRRKKRKLLFEKIFHLFSGKK